MLAENTLKGHKPHHVNLQSRLPKLPNRQTNSAVSEAYKTFAAAVAQQVHESQHALMQNPHQTVCCTVQQS
jgi:hypothetical protein